MKGQIAPNSEQLKIPVWTEVTFDGHLDRTRSRSRCRLRANNVGLRGNNVGWDGTSHQNEILHP